MEGDAFVHMEVALWRPATRSIFRNRRAACAHMGGCNADRVQTFRLTEASGTYIRAPVLRTPVG